MITSEQLAGVILEVRSMSLSRYATDVDFLPIKNRNERVGHVFSELKDFFHTEGNQPIDQISRMVQTPRMLKTVLRHVQRTWDALHGEIDFDDLLVTTTLRFTAPAAFNFLLEHFRAIRSLKSKGIGDENKKRAEELEAKWLQLVAHEWDRTTARRLVAFLFPMWSDNSFVVEDAPQGVSVSNPTDYWLRLLDGDIGAHHIRDQEIAQSTKIWASSQSTNHFREKPLGQALATDEEFSKKFEQIAPHILDGKQFRALASELFSFMLKEHGVRANRDSAPGFPVLWRCALSHPIDADAHREWILKEITRYHASSLRLANDLYYFWSANEKIEVEFRPDHQALRASVVEGARKLYAGHPEVFLSVLDPTFMYSSYHFAVLNSEPKQGGPGFIPGDWLWFMHLLLEAGAQSPSTIVPQIAGFVCKEEPFTNSCEFQDDKARELFGDEYQRLIDLLCLQIDLSPYVDERERRRLTTVRDAAMNLAKPKAEPPSATQIDHA